MAVVLVVGCLAYANGLRGPFVFDDQTAIERNPTIASIGAALFPPPESPVTRRPVVNVTFALNQASGGGVFGYHVVNLGIHLAAALALLGVVRHTLRLPRLRARFGAGATSIAGASALLWVVHPLNNEVVTYVSQRTEALMGLCFLFTLYAAIRSLDPSGGRRWSGAALVACAIGMGCKESMVTAPVIVMLHDRVFAFETLREAWHRRWRLYVGLMASWIILGALLLTGGRSTVGFSAGVGTWVYLQNQARFVARYLGLVIWPQALVFDYGVPTPLSVGLWLPAAVAVVALGLVSIVALATRPVAGFSLVAFWITLAPTSSVVPIVSEVAAERRMYLPLAALIALITASTWWYATRRSASPSSSAPRWWVAAMSLVVLVLAARTAARNSEYSSAVRVWTSSVERFPQSRSRYNLAVALGQAGRPTEAVAQLRAIGPGDPTVEWALGSELFAQRQFTEAIPYLRAYLRHPTPEPNRAAARELLARSLTAQGATDEAVREYEALLDETPSAGDAHGHFADLLLSLRRAADAIPHYRLYLLVRSTDARALTNLGLAQAATGNIDEAISAFERAVAADPGTPLAHRYLASAFAQREDAPRAEAHARAQLAIDGQDVEAHRVLGLSLAAVGRLADAEAAFAAALELRPGDAGLQRSLESVRRQRARMR